jgi:hypothetical protein
MKIPPDCYLKGLLHEIFYFFSSKAPILSPDSYPKFILNLKSNSPRYSNYLSLCIDSVNILLQASYKLSAFYGWYWTHLNISWIISLYPIPLTRQSWVCMPVSVWFIFRTLSRRRVRLHVNWVNMQWDSTSTDSTQKAPTFTKIWSFHIDSVDVESHSALTQLTRNETRRQLSHRRMLKNSKMSANSSTKSKTPKSLIIWPIYVWSVQKTGTKKSATGQQIYGSIYLQS